jgi:hypothetical protein
MDGEKSTKYGLRARVVHRRHKGGQGLGAIGGEKDREAVVASGINPRALSKAERAQFGGRGNEYIAVRWAAAGWRGGRGSSSDGARAPQPLVIGAARRGSGWPSRTSRSGCRRAAARAARRCQVRLQSFCLAARAVAGRPPRRGLAARQAALPHEGGA